MTATASSTLDDVVAALREASSLCVVGHVRPDGDCVVSQLRLGMALRAAGKSVQIWKEDPLPRKLGVLARWMRDRFYFDEIYAVGIRLTHDTVAAVAD